MKPTRKTRVVHIAVALSAMCFVGVGMLLLFAPEEVRGIERQYTNNSFFIQLFGAAFLGFGVMNWTVRRSLLGGICGKAVIVGNQVHLTVGTLLVVKHVFLAESSVIYWAFASIFCIDVVLFLYLTFDSAVNKA
jgi:hypothetical protein